MPTKKIENGNFLVYKIQDQIILSSLILFVPSFLLDLGVLNKT
jgi:hypothetical protein